MALQALSTNLHSVGLLASREPGFGAQAGWTPTPPLPRRVDRWKWGTEATSRAEARHPSPETVARGQPRAQQGRGSTWQEAARESGG